VSTLLAGRSALVTGASRGIGAAIAAALGRAGARVVLTARDERALRDAAGNAGSDPIVIAADLTAADGVARIARETNAALGSAPDILVNNAGIFAIAPLTTMQVATFTATIATNLVAPFRLLHAFLAEMRVRGSGHIVTIGSIADRTVFPENGAYSPAKYGLRALHEVLRLETRGTGVRATLVAPGSVATELWDTVRSDTQARADAGPERVLPDATAMLSPADVAAAVVYAVTQPSSVNVDELRLSHA